MKLTPQYLSGVSITMLISALMFSGSAAAYEPDQWIFRFGAMYMSPQDSNSVVQYAPGGPTIYPIDIEFSDETQLGINATYMFARNLGVQFLTSTPFDYSINRTSATTGTMNTTLGTVKAVPLTVSLQLYFMDTNTRVQPYLGFGVNYTSFYDPDVNSSQNAAIDYLEVDNAWAASFEAGIDIAFTEDWVINIAASYIDTETEISFDDVDDSWVIDDIDLTPLAFTLGFGYRF